MANPAAKALIEAAAKRRYERCVAMGVPEYLCAHDQAQQLGLDAAGPVTDRREIFRNRLTFEEDAGL
jgi:hypothetical protein